MPLSQGEFQHLSIIVQVYKKALKNTTTIKYILPLSLSMNKTLPWYTLKYEKKKKKRFRSTGRSLKSLPKVVKYSHLILL